MLKKLVAFIVLIILTVAALPAIDGFMFKRYFQTYVNAANKNIPVTAGVKIQVTSYKMGWLESKAEVLISLKEDSSVPYSTIIPKKYPVNITITHGPLTIANGTWKLAYANIKYAIKIPFVNNNPLVINSLFGLFSNNINTTYHLNKISIPELLTWNGLNGELVTSGNGKSRLVSTLNIGELVSNNTDMTFKLSPVQIYNEATIDLTKHTMSEKSNMLSDGFSYSTEPDKTYSMKKFLFTASNNIESSLLQYQSSLNISQLTLPLSKEISLDNFLFSSKLTNLSFTLPDQINFDTPSLNSLPSHITPSSNMELKMGFGTSDGRTDANITATNITFPETTDSKETAQYPSKYDVKIKLQIPKKTAEVLLANYIHSEDMIKNAKSLINPDTSAASDDDDSPKPEADYVLKQLVLRGFLLAENDHYSLSVAMTQDTVILNGLRIYDVPRLMVRLNTVFDSAPIKTCISYITNLYGQMVCGEYEAVKETTPDEDVITTTEEAEQSSEPTAAPEPVAPTPEPIPEPEAAPIPAPEPDAVAEPVAAPAPKPEPVAAPEPEPTPEPIAAPEPEPIVASAPKPEPVAAPTPEPEPAATPAPEPEPLVAPTPKPEPVVAPAPKPEPVAAPAVYGCYWLQTKSGKSSWIFIKELATKEDCFNMDSCNGGKGLSQGGCFKWSTDADAAAQPW